MWARSGPKDIGATVAAALGRARSADEARAAAEAFHEAEGRSAGNGSLMRTVPIAIRYRRLEGGHNDAPAYVGETSFIGSFWRVLGERAMVVEMTVVPALAAQARHRRELSREAEQVIRVALGLSGSAPETIHDRQA